MARDSFGRRIDYLRISLTDRCNLRCVYCMPEEGVRWRSHEEILTFEEIERFSAIAVEEGISKIRLTGGEPLVRRGVVDHVRRLKSLTGLDEIALTTNGTLLSRYAEPLAEAGLSRVNISLDSLDEEVYSRITRGGRLKDALAGMDAALAVGMGPVKVNTVVVRSLNQDLFAFARMTLTRPLHVRFIEYMPIGEADAGCGGPEAGWKKSSFMSADEILEVVSSAGARAGFGELLPVSKDEAPGGWGPARYYEFAGAAGTVCVISPLSHHFCGECNRLRLTADGRVRPCLFCDEELDARAVLRMGSEEDVREVIRAALRCKPEGHGMRVGTVRGMSQIGG